MVRIRVMGRVKVIVLVRIESRVRVELDNKFNTVKSVPEFQP